MTMDLASLVHQYYDAFMERFGETLLPEQRKALVAILRCQTPAAGELHGSSSFSVDLMYKGIKSTPNDEI